MGLQAQPQAKKVARSVVFWYFGRYGSGILVFWVICEWYFGILALPKYR